MYPFNLLQGMLESGKACFVFPQFVTRSQNNSLVPHKILPSFSLSDFSASIPFSILYRKLAKVILGN